MLGVRAGHLSHCLYVLAVRSELGPSARQAIPTLARAEHTSDHWSRSQPLHRQDFGDGRIARNLAPTSPGSWRKPAADLGARHPPGPPVWAFRRPVVSCAPVPLWRCRIRGALCRGTGLNGKQVSELCSQGLRCPRNGKQIRCTFMPLGPVPGKAVHRDTRHTARRRSCEPGYRPRMHERSCPGCGIATDAACCRLPALLSPVP